MHRSPGATHRTLVSPSKPWSPGIKYKSVWLSSKHPHLLSQLASLICLMLNFYYCYKHFSRKQNRIQIENHGLYFLNTIIWAWSPCLIKHTIKQKKKNFLFKMGKEKKQHYKNSIQQFSCCQRTLFSTQQINLWLLEVGQYFSCMLVHRIPTHNCFPNIKASLRAGQRLHSWAGNYQLLQSPLLGFLILPPWTARFSNSS